MFYATVFGARRMHINDDEHNTVYIYKRLISAHRPTALPRHIVNALASCAIIQVRINLNHFEANKKAVLSQRNRATPHF